jgi:ankyrin repeat protein
MRQPIAALLVLLMSLRGGSGGSEGVPTHSGRGPAPSSAVGGRGSASDLLLWQSADEADIAGVRRALQQGASVNARNLYDSKRAALHYVVSNRNASCLPCARASPADAGADPTCRCRLLVLDELIRSGANASLPCALGARAIHLAAATGAVALCKALVHVGASVDIRDHSRRRALHFAAVSLRMRRCSLGFSLAWKMVVE